MGLISKTTTVKWNPKNKKFFVEKGYIFTEMGKEFIVRVADLGEKSSSKVECKCDSCERKLNIKWANYTLFVKDDGKYYCVKCARTLFGVDNAKRTKLRKSISFEQWCYNNQRQNILSRWDYELNECMPNEISYGTKTNYWFKCPYEKHHSELKFITDFTSGKEGSMSCNKCNSIAQWGIDNLVENFLQTYWDYEKNSELGINPWTIGAKSHKKVWFICQEKEYHGSYYTNCSSFTHIGTRCPFCFNTHGKVHELDSLTEYVKNEFKDDFINQVWSEYNRKQPLNYSPMSHSIVWWKCPNKKHDDFKRSVKNSNKRDFRCPSCEFSKGEKEIENHLLNNNILFIPQMKFDGLIGLGGGLLSYDFYLPKLNLLMEYQGEQHERYIQVFHRSKKEFEKQLEHDKRKREFTTNNNINLLEIWYWDFDSINEILSNEFIKILKHSKEEK